MAQHKGEKDGGVPCPKCSARGTMCTDSRRFEEGTRRRRKCIKCGAKFKTLEYATEGIAFNEPLGDKIARTMAELSVIMSRLESIKAYLDFAKDE